MVNKQKTLTRLRNTYATQHGRERENESVWVQESVKEGKQIFIFVDVVGTLDTVIIKLIRCNNAEAKSEEEEEISRKLN